jgi:hypothetical protein
MENRRSEKENMDQLKV